MVELALPFPDRTSPEGTEAQSLEDSMGTEEHISSVLLETEVGGRELRRRGDQGRIGGRCTHQRAAGD